MAADQQGALPGLVVVGNVVGEHVDHRPVAVAVAFGAAAGPQSLPGPGGQAFDQVGDGGGVGRGPHPVVGLDGDHIAVGQVADRRAGFPAAVDLIGGAPGVAAAVGGQAGEHVDGELGLGREHHLLRDPSQLAAFLVGCPCAGQEQAPIDQRVPGRRGVRQMHGHLAQADPTQRAGVLAGRTDGIGGGFLIAGRIDDEHHVQVAEPVDRPSGDPLADGVILPAGPGQEMVQHVRAAVTDRLAQGPAVGRLVDRQHRFDHVPAGQPGFSAWEAVGELVHQPFEADRPAFMRYGDPCGHRIWIFSHKRSGCWWPFSCPQSPPRSSQPQDPDLQLP